LGGGGENEPGSERENSRGSFFASGIVTILNRRGGKEGAFRQKKSTGGSSRKLGGVFLSGFPSWRDRKNFSSAERERGTSDLWEMQEGFLELAMVFWEGKDCPSAREWGKKHFSSGRTGGGLSIQKKTLCVAAAVKVRGGKRRIFTEKRKGRSWRVTPKEEERRFPCVGGGRSECQSFLLILKE